MTAKEKAQDLYFKFYSEILSLRDEPAKQCALIAVDEIIKSNPTKVTENAVWFKLNIEYWQEVKQEIEKL